MKKVVAILLFLLVLTILFIPATRAQGPSFAEGFDDVGPTEPGTDGPANLIARGWLFRNQSQPRGSSSWYGSDGTQMLTPHSGTGMMAADLNSAALPTPGAAISNWAIVPAVTGQQAGTSMSFVVAGSYTGRNDRLQVRYSPSGGTDTGSSASDVGDFTQLLLDVNPVPTMGWEEFELTLPGPGRVAFRYYLPPPIGAGTQWANFFAIDTLVIGSPPPGPIPIPLPGQSVTWGLDLSPIEVTGRLIIPEDGTVLVEPGVEIQMNPNSTLVINGTVQGEGTETSPIQVAAAADYPPAVEVNGTLELTHAVIGGQVRPGSGSTTRFDQTRFQDHGVIYAAGWHFSQAAYLQIDNSHFEGPGTHINLSDATVVLRDTTFHNASLYLLYTHIYLDNLDFDGGGLHLNNDSQPDLIDNVIVRNAEGAALQLGGGNAGNDYFLGPTLTLEDNEYPVGVTNGGLLPGSSVPATGNTHNAVRGPGDDDDLRGPVTWADVGVPYEIPGYGYLWGRWRFLPDTTFKLAPGAGFESEIGWVEARGEPGRPVTFTRLNPAQPWYRLGELERLEHAVVEGGQNALVFDGGLPNYVDSTRFENNDQAIVGYSYVRGSQFLDNNIALASSGVNARGEQMPNSFEGNGLAAQGALDARHNWWGSPTGPTTPENPGGTGDPIALGVPFQPFRTSPPDYSDSPPVVHLNEIGPLLEPGSKTMLMWSATDEGTITGYRIRFSPAGNDPSSYSLVAELPASQHAFEWTVPDIGFQVTGEPASIRVEAMDDQGQIGWDATYTTIPSGRIEGTLVMNPAPSGTYPAGDEVSDVCWTASGLNEYVSGVDAFLLLEADHQLVSLGGVTTYLDCLPLPLQMPLVQTEDARLVLRIVGSLNDQKWFFSEPFTIQADPRVGDAPPSVTLVSPQAGQVFSPGQAVPITWQAADDEGLRSFEVQATFDAGRTWQVVASDLPASASSYDWITAPNANLSDVRVRVVARDLRFQNASDGAQRAFAIGEAPPTAGTSLHLPIVSR